MEDDRFRCVPHHRRGSMVQLPPHFHPDFTNVTLFTVTPAFPRGTYELACVLSDPITGEIFNRRVDRFSVR